MRLEERGRWHSDQTAKLTRRTRPENRTNLDHEDLLATQHRRCDIDPWNAFDGLWLGLPFFIRALIGTATGRIPNRGHSPASDAFFQTAELYLLLVVLPCSAVLSAAVSAFVAPKGQERRFAAGAFFYSVQMLLIMLVLAGALLAYAGTGPLWERTLRNLTFPALLQALGASLLASAVGSAAGCAIETSARLRKGPTTRLLQKLGKVAKPSQQ